MLCYKDNYRLAVRLPILKDLLVGMILLNICINNMHLNFVFANEIWR